MQLYGIGRGIIQMRDDWVAQMRAQKFPFPRKNLNVCQCGQELVGHVKDHCTNENKEFTPREEIHMIQGSLRPIELFEYTFPKEEITRVLNSVHASKEDNHQAFWGGWAGKKAAGVLRKMLGAKKIPEVEKTDLPMEHTVFTPGYGMNVIGIRDDKEGVKPEWGYEQEML